MRLPPQRGALPLWSLLLACALTVASCDGPGAVGPGTAPGSVRLVTPDTSAVLRGVVPLRLDVDPTVSVADARFLLSGTPLGPAYAEPPFELAFDTRSWPNDSYWLAGEIHTTSGERVLSNVRVVTIHNEGTLRVEVGVAEGSEGSNVLVVRLNGDPAGHLPAAGGTLEMPELAPGQYTVDLRGLRYGCTTVPTSVPRLAVVADSTREVRFDVECLELPNPVIAFASGGEIYRSQLDGQELSEITSSKVSEAWPDWSPDGTRLALVSDGELVVMRADGSGASRITKPVGSKSLPRWSPDGSRILVGSDALGLDWWTYDFDCLFTFTGCARHRLYLVEVEGVVGGVAPQQLTGDHTGLFNDVPGGWSTDGTRILYERLYDEGACGLYVMDPRAPAEGMGTLLLRTCLGRGSAWSASGRIVFTVPSTDGWSPDLAVVQQDGSDFHVLDVTPDVHEGGPRWTRDGGWIVFLEGTTVTLTRADGFGRFHALELFAVESFAVMP